MYSKKEDFYLKLGFQNDIHMKMIGIFLTVIFVGLTD